VRIDSQQSWFKHISNSGVVWANDDDDDGDQRDPGRAANIEN
jgi:hypothetical protein